MWEHSSPVWHYRLCPISSLRLTSFSQLCGNHKSSSPAFMWGFLMFWKLFFLLSSKCLQLSCLSRFLTKNQTAEQRSHEPPPAVLSLPLLPLWPCSDLALTWSRMHVEAPSNRTSSFHKQINMYIIFHLQGRNLLLFLNRRKAAIHVPPWSQLHSNR